MLNSFVTLGFDLEKAISFKLEDWFVPEVVSSLMAMVIVFILTLILGIKFRKANKKNEPLQKQKGLVLIFAMIVEKIENFVVGTIGERNRKYTGYVFAIGMYIFLAFIFGLTGFASPVTYLGVPLSVALLTFIQIHVTSMKDYKLAYFKRYTQPIPIFLPVNLISMWAPLLSLTLRMFGNAMSGYCIMTIIYFGFKSLSAAIFGGAFTGTYMINALGEVARSAVEGPASIFLAPIPASILHLYFDIFSGAIQTFVFVLLTMIFVASEQKPEDEIQVIKRDKQVS